MISISTLKRLRIRIYCSSLKRFHFLSATNLKVHYWAREKKNSSAEVDYVITDGTSIIPIEVKAGKGGTLKSLHLFLREKNIPMGIRFNSERPSLLEQKTALPDGKNITYALLSLPLYLVAQTRRLIRQLPR